MGVTSMDMVRNSKGQDHGPRFRRAQQGDKPFDRISLHCTVVLTVAVLFAGFGSGVSSVAVPLSVMTVPEGAVTFTVNRRVHVVFGAIALFLWQAIPPVPHKRELYTHPGPGVPAILKNQRLQCDNSKVSAGAT
jgi:hypothetical protein